MMFGPLPLVMLTVSMVFALPSPIYDNTVTQEQVIMPQKRAALVLDRLLIALQKALHEDGRGQRYERPLERDGPRTAPLRIEMDSSDMTALQRRGHASSGRGRVLRCYFNAVTCF